MSRVSLMLLSATALAMIAPTGASAQVFNMGQLTGTLSMGAVVKSERQRAQAAQHGQPVARPPALAPVSRLTFRADPARRRANMAQFYAQYAKADPAVAAQMRAAFAKQDPFAVTQAWMNPYGLSTTNLADVAATYLSIAWESSRGTTADPSKPQIVGLRNQLALAMRSNRDFANASEATKQQFADALVIQAIIAGQAVAAAKGDPAQVRRGSAAVVAGTRNSFGIDLTQVRLTGNGFEPG